MRFALVFLMLNFVFICSCKQATNEEAYIAALEKSNTFILDANKIIKGMVQFRTEDDPRQKTQEIQLKLNKIDSSTNSYIKKLKKNEAEINIEEHSQFKRDLIRNNVDSPNWDYFFEDDIYQTSEIEMIPVQVAINDVILLANQLFMFYARQFHWSDFKIDKQQAIFKVDSNTYIALFAFGASKNIKPQVTITSIVHKTQRLSPDQYSFQFKAGFYAVVMNLNDDLINRLGEYIINYEISWKETSDKPEIEYPYSNIFIIEE